MKIYYTLNNELNGIEIYFEEKPGDLIRDALKENRFRWNGRKKCWYAKQSETALDLAERLTAGRQATAEQIRKEIRQKHEETKLTIEKMQEAAKGYTFKETGEGLYAGWTGCNCEGLNLTGQELKKAIIAELKKHGIKATARSGRGYYDSFDFTIRVPAEFTVSKAEYIEKRKQDLRIPTWIRDRNTGKDIHSDALWDMSEEDRNNLLTGQYEYEYEWKTRDGEVLPTDQFRSFVETVVNSFNSDHSNGMIDYFDVGFYKSFTWKAA